MSAMHLALESCFNGQSPRRPLKATCSQAKYQQGWDVHWSAFTSCTPALDQAKVFAQGLGGVIFRLQVLTGRDVTAYSAMPDEQEVLLSPNARFVVTKACCLEADGYHYVDMVERRGEGVIF
jgi:hypothetical protein